MNFTLLLRDLQCHQQLNLMQAHRVTLKQFTQFPSPGFPSFLGLWHAALLLLLLQPYLCPFGPQQLVLRTELALFSLGSQGLLPFYPQPLLRNPSCLYRQAFWCTFLWILDRKIHPPSFLAVILGRQGQIQKRLTQERPRRWLEPPESHWAYRSSKFR